MLWEKFMFHLIIYLNIKIKTLLYLKQTLFVFIKILHYLVPL